MRHAPEPGIAWDSRNGRHVVVIVMGTDEAYSEGRFHNDEQLIAWSEEARFLDSRTAWVPVGPPPREAP